MIDKVKELIKKYKDSNDKNKKKTENLICFLILLIITLISINIIFKEEESKNEDTINKELVKEDIKNENDLEKRLAEALEKIKGVRKSKSTYNIFRDDKYSTNL